MNSVMAQDAFGMGVMNEDHAAESHSWPEEAKSLPCALVKIRVQMNESKGLAPKVLCRVGKIAAKELHVPEWGKVPTNRLLIGGELMLLKECKPQCRSFF